jgi:hypothetical protein
MHDGNSAVASGLIDQEPVMVRVFLVPQWKFVD